jgi:hypothetical protein
MEDEFKKATISEFKALHSKLAEAQELIQDVTPRLNAVTGIVRTYGWEREIEQLAQDDDWQKFPDIAKRKGEKIALLCAEYLLENDNKPTRLSELYMFLTTRGMDVGGKNPNSTLSAHLSNSGHFEGDRAKGWRLKKGYLPARKGKGWYD